MATTGDDSDRLGRRGETEFDRLVLEAGLDPAKIDPDRIGVDRIVTFPLGGHSTQVSLDRRPPPRQAVLQIKTIASTRRSASVALDKAERLAKELKPAAVFIIRADEDGTFKDMYLVHLLGPPLARVLRRLRLQHKKPSKPLHKATISFSISEGKRVEPSPAGVLAAFGGMVPRDMLAYARQKQHELETLGYNESNRYRLSFQLGESLAELQDTLLGERPLPIGNLETFERRFDVELPAPLPGMEAMHPDAVLRLSYEVNTAVKVAISSELVGKAQFDAVARAAATVQDIPDAERKIIVENRAFRITMIGASLSYKLPPPGKEIEQLALPIAEWVEAFRLNEILSRGGRIEFRFCRSGASDDLVREVDLEKQDSDEGRLHLASLVEAANELRRRISSEDVPVVYREFDNHRPRLEVLKLLLGREPFYVSTHMEHRFSDAPQHFDAILCITEVFFGARYTFTGIAATSVEERQDGQWLTGRVQASMLVQRAEEDGSIALKRSTDAARLLAKCNWSLQVDGLETNDCSVTRYTDEDAIVE